MTAKELAKERRKLILAYLDRAVGEFKPGMDIPTARKLLDARDGEAAKYCLWEMKMVDLRKFMEDDLKWREEDSYGNKDFQRNEGEREGATGGQGDGVAPGEPGDACR